MHAARRTPRPLGRNASRAGRGTRCDVPQELGVTDAEGVQDLVITVPLKDNASAVLHSEFEKDDVRYASHICIKGSHASAAQGGETAALSGVELFLTLQVRQRV